MIKITGLNVDLPCFSLSDINLGIPENQFFVLLGPTGSGKTVLLEAIAGIETVSSGSVMINGLDVTDLPPEKRGICIVYQDSCLFPHLNVADNIRYGLRYRYKHEAKSGDRFGELVDLLKIGHILKRRPETLSGGEVQRAALARALITGPRVLLLDEPFSAIDQAFRSELQQLLKTLQQTSGITFIMVTHSFSEALSLGDRAAILQNGRIEQEGSLIDIFKKPRSPFVAQFVGVKNIYPANFSGLHAQVNGVTVRVGNEPGSGRGYIAIRPEDIILSRSKLDSSIRNSFGGKVRAVLDKGYTFEVDVQAGETVFRSLITRSALVELDIRTGQDVYISFKATAVHCFESALHDTIVH